MPNSDDFRRRLHSALTNAKLTQKQAAERAGVDYKWLRRVSSSGLARPGHSTMARLDKLAAVLGVGSGINFFQDVEPSKSWTVHYESDFDLAQKLLAKLNHLIRGGLYVRNVTGQDLLNRFYVQGTPTEIAAIKRVAAETEIPMERLAEVLQQKICDRGLVSEFMQGMVVETARSATAKDQPQRQHYSIEGRKVKKAEVAPKAVACDEVSDDEEVREMIRETAEAMERSSRSAQRRR